MNNVKSSFPALVDISITTACPFGCKFCYTSSKKEGNSATIQYLRELSKTLRDSGVFEVVFGGGEPTLYKDQYNVDILDVLVPFKYDKFKVGVTTKNYNFHKHPNFADAIRNIDSIAISCNTMADLEKAKLLKNAIHNVKNARCTVYFQCILGVQTWEDFQIFLKTIAEDYYANLTILGYKDFGFGTSQKPTNIPDDWIELVKSLKIRIGADSILVNKYREKLLAAGVTDYYLVGKEGNSSCYIDAVKEVVKPSSFTDEEHPFKMDWSGNDKRFLEIFAKF
jgi:MoaA/NifB/PqqE/SkfB family radical SAM enzyme